MAPEATVPAGEWVVTDQPSLEASGQGAPDEIDDVARQPRTKLIDTIDEAVEGGFAAYDFMGLPDSHRPARRQSEVVSLRNFMYADHLIRLPIHSGSDLPPCPSCGAPLAPFPLYQPKGFRTTYRIVPLMTKLTVAALADFPKSPFPWPHGNHRRSGAADVAVYDNADVLSIAT